MTFRFQITIFLIVPILALSACGTTGQARGGGEYYGNGDWQAAGGNTDAEYRTIAQRIETLYAIVQQANQIGSSVMMEYEAIQSAVHRGSMHPYDGQMRINQLQMYYAAAEQDYYRAIHELESLHRQLYYLIENGTPYDWAREVLGALRPFSSGDPTMQRGVDFVGQALTIMRQAGVI